VFIESKGDISGVEALVFEDGAATLPTKKFRHLLRIYKGRKSLTLEADTEKLSIGNFEMRILKYEPCPQPPGEFRVFAPSGATLKRHRNSIAIEIVDCINSYRTEDLR
jgi:hypothetical protein